MIRNYIKIAWRNIFRNRLISMVHIVGLAIALLCVVFIGLYIKDEKSYDRFLTGADEIYRVNLDGKMGPEEFRTGNTPPPVGKALKDNFPEVTDFTRLYQCSPENISYTDGTQKKVFTEDRLFSVDSNFLAFFTYPLLEGDASNCLTQPYSLVLTASTAKKYFGQQPALGRQLHLDEWNEPFIVTAVVQDLPANSSLQFDLLMPNSAMPPVKYFDWSWVWLQMSTFVKLNQASATPETVARMEEKFPAMVKQLAAGAFERIGKPFDEFVKNGGRWNLFLQPLEQVHLGSIYSKHITHGNRTTIYVFSSAALLVLLLACTNAMNLSTAQAMRRSKEVGVRKVLGSARRQLIWQFLTESGLFGLLAAILSLVCVFALLPFFNRITDKSLLLNEVFTLQNGLFLLGILGITTLLSGLYPAFHLTGFDPAKTLKGNPNPKNVFHKNRIRNGLVVFQFTISTVLIISSIVILNQLRFTGQVNLGFDKEHVLLLNQAEKLGESGKSLIEELRGIPGIKEASLSTGVPSKNSFGDFYVPESNAEGSEVVKDIMLNSFMVDDYFLNTMGMSLRDGRGFSPHFNDSTSVVLNETAVRQIGWDIEKAVGQYIQYPGNGNQRFQVVGIIKDFNSESLHTAITPFALFHFSSRTFRPNVEYISLRLQGGDQPRTLEMVRNKWKSFTENIPYDATFMDDELEKLYREDKKVGVIFTIFTVLSVFTGCIGLFGLVTATTEQRIKEIGIRKVLGASVANIVRMLSSDFVKLVLIAIVIASPVAWWAMNKWLADFAYRIDIEWWMFALAGLAAVVIALATVSWQAIRAALANPVESLRDE